MELSPTDGRTVVPLSRTAWATERLRSDILSGELAPGSRLVPRLLCERYSVSATPLREAMQSLSREGLVELTPQLGARVSPLSAHEAKDLFELRIKLEPEAIFRSLSLAPPERFEQIAHAYHAMGTNQDSRTFVEEHNRFHRLARIDCDSEWLLRLVDLLAINCGRYRRVRRLDASVEAEHRDIAAAVASRSPLKTAEMVEKHLLVTFDYVSSILGLEAD